MGFLVLSLSQSSVSDASVMPRTQPGCHAVKSKSVLPPPVLPDDFHGKLKLYICQIIQVNAHRLFQQQN